MCFCYWIIDKWLILVSLFTFVKNGWDKAHCTVKQKKNPEVISGVT